MKNLKCKLILIFTTFIVATLFVNNIISLAIELGPDNLTDPGMYCLEHGAALKYNGPTVTRTVRVREKDPDDPTKTIMKTETYKYSSTYVNSYSARTGSFDSGEGNKAERKNKSLVAYLLDPSSSHGPAQSPTAQQRAIWAEIGTVRSVLNASDTAGGGGSNNINKQATNFAENNEAKITRKTDEKGTIITDNYMVGPLKVEYNGTITDIIVTDKNNKQIDSKYISFIQSGKNVSAKNIKKNVEFYVINKSGQEVKQVKVKSEKSSVYYRVRYTLYTSSGVKLRDINGHEYAEYQSSRSYTKAQTLVKVRRSKYNKTTYAEVNFSLKAEKGDLELSKKGIYGIDGKLQDPETLENVTFKIYCDIKDASGKWIKQESNGKITYVDKYEDATEFTTDKNGKITIKNLYSGENYSYSAIEIKNGNPYYNDVIEIKDSETNQSKDKDQQKAVADINGIKYNGIIGISIFYNKVNKTTINDNRTSGDLTIIKQDSKFNELKLQGAEFKIKLVKASNIDKLENMWLTIPEDCMIENSTYDYNKVLHDKYLASDIEKAGVFTTNENGIIDVKKIVNGTYQVYETKAPEGYDITKQEGYDPENKWVDCGTIEVAEVNTLNNSVKYTVNNKKVIVSLKGMVWVDGKITKDGNEAYNSVYDQNSDELLLEEIPVTLYQRQRDENGNLIPLATDEDGRITSGATEIATTTLKEGYYEFTTKNSPSYTGEDKDLYYWDLADCFVEFIYDNKHQYDAVNATCDTGYITADYLQEANVMENGKIVKKLDMTRNSKAQEYNATPSTLNDTKLGGVEEEIKGRAITTPDSVPQTLNKDSYKEILEREGKDDGEILTTYYNKESYCVENINLGLQYKYSPEFLIDENIAYIKVEMNGYSYKYVFGGTEKILKTVPTVNEQLNRYFDVAVYPSDIAYNKENKTDELKVYVVYRIDVTNTTQTTSDDIYDNVYEEQKMYLSSLTNEYDHNRYELSSDINEDIDEKVASRDFALWSNEGDVVSYNLNSEDSIYKNGITNKAEENKISSYVEYRVKEEILQKILNNGLKVEDIENAATRANVIVYHEYIRTDNLWHDNYEWTDGIRAYEGHKEPQPAKTQNDSNGQTYFLHRSVDETGNSPALFLKLKLPEKERTILGRVFEDKRTQESINDNTNLGSGTYESQEENVAKNVKVEILSTQKDENGEYKPAILYKYDKDAEEKYTHPDPVTTTGEDGKYSFVGVVPGEYYLRFTYGDGTQTLCDVNGNPIENSEIYSNQYRSTIITGESIKEAMEGEFEDTKYTWYKEIDDDKYNIATDVLDQRNNDEDPITEELPGNVEANINAYSPKTSITIEDDEDENPDEGEATDNGSKAVNYEEFDKFNFGIIDEIDTELTLSKKMTNVSLTASQGTTFVNSNPKNEEQFVSDLDKETEGGSKYAKIEIDANNMYGSTLKTTYEIEVSNISLKDYVENATDEHFGWYYKYGDNQYAKPKKVTIKEITDKLDSKYTFESEDIENLKIEQDQKVQESDEDQYKYRNLIITLEESDNYDDKWKIASDKSDETSSLSFDYTVRSLLSSNDDDSQLLNDAKITSIRLSKLSSLQTEFKYPEDHTTLTITPPTGENRSNEYWIIGVVAFIVLSAGIIIIKKKILK